MYRLLLWAAVSAFVPQANAASLVRCEDGTKSVKLVISFAKKDSTAAPAKATITSGGKSKDIGKKEIKRFIRNANDFYLLFKVQTKVGPHELELNTRFNKNPRGPRTSAGTLVNKTQDERLNVTCWF